MSAGRAAPPLADIAASYLRGILALCGLFQLPLQMRRAGYRIYRPWRPVFPQGKRSSDVVVLDANHLTPSFSRNGFDVLVFNELLELVDFVRGQRLGESGPGALPTAATLDVYRTWVSDPLGTVRARLQARGFSVRAPGENPDAENYW